MSLVALVLALQAPFAAPALSPDLHEVANLKAFVEAAPLAPEHRRKLAQDLFFISPADMPLPHYVYGQNDYENIPSLVTTDSVLHLFHVAFDSTLRNMEQGPLYDRVGALTKHLLAAAIQVRAQRKTTAGHSAATRVIAYVGVADRLLGQTSPLPADVKPLVGDELVAIKDAKGFVPSNVVPSKVDMSQFLVRGHYTRSPRLQRYFRTMMWYGLVPLQLKTQAGALDAVGTRMAISLAQAVRDGRLEAEWQAVYEPTTLYAGSVNSLTPLMGISVLKELGGDPEAVDLQQFADAMAKLDPAIYRPSIKLQSGIAQGVVMKFMGQRGLLDGWVISRVTGLERPLPTGLDVMAALGSKAATDLIAKYPDQVNPRGWNLYRPRLEEAAAKVDALPETEWTRNLYTGWLNVLRAKIQPPTHAVPAFMRKSAWAQASLYGALASWAELRHDTLLYGEQTAVEMGDGDEEPPPLKGFVEPNVPFFDRLSALVSQMTRGLVARKLVDSDARENLGELADLVGFLGSCARKEVAGTSLSREEHLRIRHLEGEFENITVSMLMRGMNFNTLTEDDRDMALVADIHTADPLAFTVAVGHADDLIAIVPIDGKLYLARGPAFSYYEFTVPMSERMSDEQWKSRLREGKAPPRPFWVPSFFVAKPARHDDQ
ncbi:MAG: DUF3160 domain-containing protein [Fimbriimonadaceae bacterium]|nr:DUF3160 domain-containing protein [Fimbriimonadaceae bacterium]